MEKIIFKARCSALSQIMSEPKGKTPMQNYLDLQEEIKVLEEKYSLVPENKKNIVSTVKLAERIKAKNIKLAELESKKDDILLSDTCIKYLENWVKEKYFNRKKILKTDAIEKGTEKEFEAIYILNKALGTKYKKENEHVFNDYLDGHLDVDDSVNKEILDTKVCESFDTFPLFEDDIENAYWWQLQGYMLLKGEDYKIGKIAKILVNSPEWMIKKKIKNSFYSLAERYENDSIAFMQEHESEIKSIMLNHVFDQTIKIDGKSIDTEDVIPLEKRYKLFTVERDNDAIASIEKRVIQCRKYLESKGY